MFSCSQLKLSVCDGASASHPLKCERASLPPHIKQSLWNLREGRWGQKNIQPPPPKKKKTIAHSTI